MLPKGQGFIFYFSPGETTTAAKEMATANKFSLHSDHCGISRPLLILPPSS